MMSEMTDKELIELAARTYVDKCWHDDAEYMQAFLTRWSPLTDDGDALRLAVMLGFVIDRNPSGTIIYAGLWDSAKLEGVDVENGESIEATRRAIVRAAAQIGKEME
ncbi:MAG: hypothetical protein ACRDBQ_22195 [Shewanella sp.]